MPAGTRRFARRLLALCAVVLVATTVQAQKLTIQGDRFAIDGTPNILLLCACARDSTSPTPPTQPPPPPTSAFTATFDPNPVPFRTTGCSFSTPQGWYAQARLQETAGVAFTPATLTQKLDGSTVSFLMESFGSRFGACSGMTFTPGMILASGAVCASVGVCTTSSYTTYQFSIAGTDANGHAVTFDSPVLRLGAQ